MTSEPENPSQHAEPHRQEEPPPDALPQPLREAHPPEPAEQLPQEAGQPHLPEWRVVPVRRVDRSGPSTLSFRRAQLWSLVLESRYIESRVETGERGLHLLVRSECYHAACAELRNYLAENRNWPPLLPPVRPMFPNTLPTLSVLILLATFYNVTRLDVTVLNHHPVDWIEIGNAHAGQILQGQWWRTATALTLHADGLHLMSNLTIGGFFVVYLCRDLGSGLAWTLLLASGMLGNLANAEIQLPSHSSVGASTAVFAAVASLGAISVMRYRHHLRRRWPLPVAAALSLLVLLGTEGKQTDLGAHLFGFVFGFLLGLLTEWLVGIVGRPGRLINALLALTASGVMLFAWWSALSSPP